MFDTFGNTCWHMLVTLTTANFPDVMMYGYTQYRWTSLFFVLYLIIGLFFLLNLLLAVFCNYYNAQVEAVALKVLEQHSNFMKEGLNYLDKQELNDPSKEEGVPSQTMEEEAKGNIYISPERRKDKMLKVEHCALLIQEMTRAGYIYIYIYIIYILYIYIYII